MRAKRELDGRTGEVIHQGMGFARCEAALLDTKQYARMLSLLEVIPAPVRKLGRVKTLEIAALMRTDRLDEAQALLESRIVLTDVREGDVLLTDLWFELMARRERGGADEESLAWARENLKPPESSTSG